MKVQIFLALALLAPSQVAKSPVDERVASGISALHDYAFDKALAEFRSAQELEPNNVMAVWGEAMTHFRPLWLSVNRQAMRELVSQLGGTPGEGAKHAKSTKERLYLELGESEAAADSFRRALGRRPNRLRALLGLSRAEPNTTAHQRALLDLLSDADESLRDRIAS